jgi:hypothetical protein
MNVPPRDHFLIEFYNNVWLNIRRAETSLWTLFSFYFPIVVGLLVYREQVGITVITFIIVLVSFIFSIFSFNLNLWYIRNLRLTSRVEKECLVDNDFDKIILPKIW